MSFSCMNFLVCKRFVFIAIVCCCSTVNAQNSDAWAELATKVVARATPALAVTGADVMADVLSRVPPAERDALLKRPEALQQIAGNLLLRRVLAAEAERDGLPKSPLVGAAMNIALDRVLSDARLAALDAQNAPSEAAVEARARQIYQIGGPRFERPAESRASHILIENASADSLKKAKEILARLRAGESFEALAKAESADPGSAARGGDLGFFGPGKMVRPFEDAVNALSKPGDVSEPVESQFGYHIIRLDERRPKGLVDFETVRAQLQGEARAAVLNNARIEKVQSMNKDFVFDRAALELLGATAGR